MPNDATAVQVTTEAFREILDERMPFATMMGMQIERIDANGARMRAVYDEKFLRPGGTIAGPIMMGLADAAMYAVVLARIGPVELAVTTELSINFLRKPAPGDIIAEASLLKVGKRLAVGEVRLHSADDPHQQLIAHVTSTYSIPPPEQR